MSLYVASRNPIDIVVYRKPGCGSERFTMQDRDCYLGNDAVSYHAMRGAESAAIMPVDRSNGEPLFFYVISDDLRPRRIYRPMSEAEANRWLLESFGREIIGQGGEESMRRTIFWKMGDEYYLQRSLDEARLFPWIFELFFPKNYAEREQDPQEMKMLEYQYESAIVPKKLKNGAHSIDHDVIGKMYNVMSKSTKSSL